MDVPKYGRIAMPMPDFRQAEDLCLRANDTLIF